ncbi:MAG: hypothetical protein ACM3JH_03445, partial [Acidithiobacillales bacterium]
INPTWYIWWFQAGTTVDFSKSYYASAATLSSITVTLAAPGSYAVGVQIYATDPSRPPGQQLVYPRCQIPVVVVSCERPGEFCTVTQGFWGSAASGQGKFNGVLASDLLSCLMGDPLTVGVPGTRSLTINDAACIMSRLPGSGTPAALPDFASLGSPDRTISGSACETTSPSIPLNKFGRFNNTLLGQTITLALNLRMDGALGGYVLPASITTVPALPGPDGVVGEPLECVSGGADPNDDSANLDPLTCNAVTRTIPSSLVGLTVNQLLDLANQALAGIDTGFSLSDINAAVSAVNEAFDKCRFLEPDGCPPPLS